LLKIITDTLQTTSPLVNKALLTWLTEVFIFHQFGPTSGVPSPRGIGYGIGLAVTLFAMQGTLMNLIKTFGSHDF
jgi:hypothetical protein